jgi:IclR family pca regulon transcriptional regulator
MSKDEQAKHDNDQGMIDIKGNMSEIKPTEIVLSLVKGLNVINAFNQQRKKMTLSHVAQFTGYTRAATRRFLLTLVSEGYAKQEGNLFSLTPKILDLGFSYLSTIDVWQHAQPLMANLVDQLDESCSAAVLDNFDVVYVARVATTKRIMSIGLTVGTRLPAIATSMGRVLIANLSEDAIKTYISHCPKKQFTDFTLMQESDLLTEIMKVKNQGYSIVEQEFELGLTSISVPIFDREGKISAALSISVHSVQFSKADVINTILPALTSCALRITQQS